MTTVLGQRALNRASLERQLLLRRHRTDPHDVVRELVGLHAQVPHNPYTALWNRVDAFDPWDFSGRFENGEFVRISLQRSTIHTVTAEDALTLRPVLQVPQDRTLHSAFGRYLTEVDIDRVAERARELVERQPMSFDEIGKALIDDWPTSTVQALGMVARHRLAMVQVPPRGLWQRGGLARHTTAEHWLGAELARSDAPDAMVMRYLAAFGPASVMDIQAWCGLTRLREVVERHRDELVTFADPGGVELFDLPDAPRPPEDTPAPVRFLPEYDNIFIGYRDRTRVISDDARKRLFTGNTAHPVLLIDGFVAGTWKLRTDAKEQRATLEITPFVRPNARQRDELEAEGRALLAFHAEDSEHDLTFGEPKV